MSLTYSRVVQLSPGFLQALCLWVLSRLTSGEETMAFEDPAQCPLNCEVFLPGCWGCNVTHSPCELRKQWYPCPSRSPDLGGISHTCDGQHSLSAGWVFCAQLPRAPGSCTPNLSSISPRVQPAWSPGRQAPPPLPSLCSAGSCRGRAEGGAPPVGSLSSTPPMPCLMSQPHMLLFGFSCCSTQDVRTGLGHPIMARSGCWDFHFISHSSKWAPLPLAERRWSYWRQRLQLYRTVMLMTSGEMTRILLHTGRWRGGPGGVTAQAGGCGQSQQQVAGPPHSLSLLESVTGTQVLAVQSHQSSFYLLVQAPS